jgi:DoxX-like family
MSEKTTIHAGQSVAQTASLSKGRLWTGGVMGTLAALFLIMDGVMKLMKPAFVVQATVQLGYPESVIIGLGIVLLACTVLYLIPRTAVLGAILLTGYLGGAVATHVRIGDPLFSHTLFPVYLAVLLWGGLCLRDPRLRTLIPLRKNDV